MLCLMPPRTWLALLAARALLTHVQLAIDQDPQVPFRGTAFQHLIPQFAVTKDWNRLSREAVESPSQEIIKNCVDAILCHRDGLSRKVVPDDPLWSLPT
ncbi:hypothetical protein BTVI_10925 [Pitangus sulphuratus]|nr:hypothetical protein BTVI_10925 [Pitangus sulphuratus]